MTSERKENWINITTPDGKKMIAAPSYVKKLLKLDLLNIYNRIEGLERKIDHLEAPGRQAKILKLLQEHGKHNLVWIRNRVSNYQWYDIHSLLAQGLIVESKAGPVTMYSCEAE